MKKEMHGHIERLLISAIAVIATCSVTSAKGVPAIEHGIELRINSSGEFLDIYLINGSKDIISVYPRIAYSGIEHNVSFSFFKGKERCDECILKSETTMPLSVPPIKNMVALAPSEIMGRRFNIGSLASSYSLNPGCYGIYATYQERRPPHGTFAGKIVSNGTRLCVPGAEKSAY